MDPLYKFVSSPEAVRFLLEGTVKFTPIRELNDPSELIPSVVTEEVVASREQLRRSGYSERDLIDLQKQGALLARLAPQFQAVDVPQTCLQASTLIRSRFFDNIALLESRMIETGRAISQKVGLLCLSRGFNALPMWAHYAANAHGFAVELHRLEEVFPGGRHGRASHTSRCTLRRISAWRNLRSSIPRIAVSGQVS
jgi:hypothetical protein